MSRPSDYSDDLAERICAGLMDGQSLRRVCADEDMPDRRTIYRWMQSIPDFATKCAHARVIQADAIEEDMADIEDRTLCGELDPAAARAVLSSKQWRASKLAPKKYGEKLHAELTGAGGGPMQFQRIERVVVDTANPNR